MISEMALLVIDRQHISEKATILAEKRKQYTFKVSRSSNKHQIKDAVEQLFNVKVAAVSVLNVLGKKKRFKNTAGKRKDWKKAYVTLHPECDIDFKVND